MTQIQNFKPPPEHVQVIAYWRECGGILTRLLTFIFYYSILHIYVYSEVIAIETVSSVAQMQALAAGLREKGKKIALVPTMGYLHEGHLSLFRIGRREGDCLIASIFVNPTQFAPGEDLATYPKSLERDLALAAREGVDIVFTPEDRALYPQNFQTYVTLEKLPEHLCGLSRPTFFRGVATVVTKLFNIVRPHVAVFGEKDFQQLAVVRRLVADLNLAVEIVGGPIIREPDGLAMSSRNSYLTPGQRSSAGVLNRALQQARTMVKDGVRQTGRLVAAATELILAAPETRIDYVAVCDPETLENVAAVDRPALMALAVFVGKTRLIDNCLLRP